MPIRRGSYNTHGVITKNSHPDPPTEALAYGQRKQMRNKKIWRQLDRRMRYRPLGTQT